MQRVLRTTPLYFIQHLRIYSTHWHTCIQRIFGFEARPITTCLCKVRVPANQLNSLEPTIEKVRLGTKKQVVELRLVISESIPSPPFFHLAIFNLRSKLPPGQPSHILNIEEPSASQAHSHFSLSLVLLPHHYLNDQKS
ncbi:hypothetical protein I7I50_11319 [Histoplasma capsulatum G186AR]|uniref:Uncharacterized protein n=1 Tax=Ajellomyces capsulatus TaxID=5037 RepID=A0A8H7Z526_AJECA|nr:hypothetical protein I7I52_02557 [Histoplasma capsulatum]QSS69882.1 hypothetical protein I7I50_11319 [Histoplasma capsulatum G186AR]